MTSWRDQILAEFTPNVARLTLVADPDDLLLEEGIRERGFELIPFEDPIRLYTDLKGAGMEPWIDDVDLLPGQNWRQTINRAIKESRHVLTLLSLQSLSKRGYVQKELKTALDVLDEFPPDDIFVIPVRIDECKPLDERLEGLHWVDLFPSYKYGLERILRVFQSMGESVEENYVPRSVDKQDEGAVRVLRGGSWGSVAGLCRTACRGWLDPRYRYHDYGFRLSLRPGQ